MRNHYKAWYLGMTSWPLQYFSYSSHDFEFLYLHNFVIHWLRTSINWNSLIAHKSQLAGLWCFVIHECRSIDNLCLLTTCFTHFGIFDELLVLGTQLRYDTRTENIVMSQLFLTFISTGLELWRSPAGEDFHILASRQTLKAVSYLKLDKEMNPEYVSN